MGIHDFTSTFEPTEAETTLAKLNNFDFAVDAFPELFRGTSMQYAAKLTNKLGEPTLHLKIALDNACARKKMGRSDIWCFDSRDPRPQGDTKERTLITRGEIRKKNEENIKRLRETIQTLETQARKISRSDLLKIDPTFDISFKEKRDMLDIMLARNPDVFHFNKMIVDVMMILDKLGIQHAVAPPGCDAEKLAAQLGREDMVDGVISVDTDSLVYGNAKQVKKIAGKSGKYSMYDLNDVLKRYDITETQLAQVASVMGCDFCAKTPGVGAKTVIKKVKEGAIKYTDDQLAAQAKFLDRSSVEYTFHDPICTKQSLDELTEWLVTEQGFGRENVEKKLKTFYP